MSAIEETEDVLGTSEWNDLTVAQLKEELVGRGLETGGRKADLVARLEASDRELMEHKGDEAVTGNGDGGGEGEESEFVVWNDEHDPDKLLGEGEDDHAGGEECPTEEGGPAVDDAPVENSGDGDHTEATTEAKAEAGTEDVEFGVDMSKERDHVIVTWRCKKIVVPFRDEVQKEMRYFSKMQNVIMYPVELADLYSDIFRRHVELAVNVSMELDETIPGKPVKGYLRLKFGSVTDAEAAMEELGEFRKEEGREMKMKHFAEDDSEGEILSHVKKEDADKRDPIVHRLLFVGNLANEVTEATLKEHFAGVLRVFLPHKEDSTNHSGYAYLEFASEVETLEALTKYQGTELCDNIVYLIKSLTQKKETFGLLRDSLRKYWLEQLHNLEGSKAKMRTKTVKELSDLEAKLLRLKRRIDKDNVVRESLGLPIPESERFGTTDADSDKGTGGEAGKDKEKESSSGAVSSARKEVKSAERRRTPPRRRYSPSTRGSSTYRGGYNGSRGGGYRGTMSGGYAPRGGRDTNVLVNQLQELVGALTHKVPEHHPRSDYGRGDVHGRLGGGGGGGGYPDSRDSGYRDSYRGGYRGSSSSSGGGYGASKRPHEDDYSGERKRRMDDGGDYGGRYGGSSDRGGYGGSYGGGSSRRGGRGGYY